jgi:hypothetical protein
MPFGQSIPRLFPIPEVQKFRSEQCIFALLPQLAAAKPMRFGAAGKGLHKRLTNKWFCSFTYFNHLRQLG